MRCNRNSVDLEEKGDRGKGNSWKDACVLTSPLGFKILEKEDMLDSLRGWPREVFQHALWD